MRFEHVAIGTKFIHQIGSKLYVFEKKSLSSAWVLDPESLTRVILTGTFSRVVDGYSVMGFAKGVEVHPLA